MDFSKILELHIEMTRSDACLGIELSLVTLETGCNGCAQKGQLGPPPGKNSRARVIAWGTLYLTVRLVEGKATRQYFYDVSIFRR